MSSDGDNTELLAEKAATMAHEIKNPLAVALANLSLIKVCCADENIRTNCDIIEKELFKINKLVIEYINLTLMNDQWKSFDLTALLDELTYEYNHKYQTVTFFRHADLPPFFFWGLQKHIRFVFANLINIVTEGIFQNGAVTVTQKHIRNTLHIDFSGRNAGSKPKDYNTTPEMLANKECFFCDLVIENHGGQILWGNRQEGSRVTISLPV